MSSSSSPAPANTLLRLTSLLLLLLAGMLIYTVLRVSRQEPQGVVADTPRYVAPPAELGADEKATISVFEHASLSVVHVTSISLRRDVFSMDVTQIPQGTGTGFVWDSAGHVVTNYHVIDQASRAQVLLHDGSVYAASIVGRAPDKDIAVLRIDAPPSKLRPIVVGSSQDLRVGQKVLAIGNPFGLDQTLTTGVISGLGREIRSPSNRAIYDVIQTDASINPGNSGGPLLDSGGNLIGINTQIASTSGASAGIGFAVPVDTVNNVVPQLIKYGKLIRPGLGVNLVSDRVMHEQLRRQGLLIMSVIPGSAADRAGLVGTVVNPDRSLILGDIIVAVDGIAVAKSDELFRALDGRKVGDTVTVTVVSGDQRRDVKVTLQSVQ